MFFFTGYMVFFTGYVVSILHISTGTKDEIFMKNKADAMKKSDSPMKNAVKNRACRSSGTPCLYVIFYLFSGIRQIRPTPHQLICPVRTASADLSGPHRIS